MEFTDLFTRSAETNIVNSFDRIDRKLQSLREIGAEWLEGRRLLIPFAESESAVDDRFSDVQPSGNSNVISSGESDKPVQKASDTIAHPRSRCDIPK